MRATARSYSNLRLTALMLTALPMLSACGGSANNNNPASAAAAEMNAPSFSWSGSGVSQVNSNVYLLASANGSVGTASNNLLATFPDPNLPLTTTSVAYSISLATGSCSSLEVLPTSLAGTSTNGVQTQVSATSCADQSTATVMLDTSQVFDSLGVDGTVFGSLTVTIDLAPKVTSAATGNTAVDGSGTTEGSGGYFAINSDNSVVVTFSKSLTGGIWNASLSGCAAGLGTAVAAPSGAGHTLAWPLTNFSSLPAGTTCTLNISQVSDGALNPDDPSDIYQSMNITFH